MSAAVRLARAEDIPALQQLDPWPKAHMWRQKITNGEVMVLELEANIIGLMRYAMLWTTVPFLGLIEIDAAHRGEGYSRLMLSFLKDHLLERGYVALLSSSQTDEPGAQRWHLHMGFTSNGIIENLRTTGWASSSTG